MRSLIVFGEDWQRHPSSSQHIVAQLLDDHRVLWVNSIGLRQPGWQWRDWQRVVEKLRALIDPRRSATADDGEQTRVRPLKVLSVLALPAPRSPVARWFNRWLVAFQVRYAQRKFGIEAPDLWIALPTAVDLIGCFGEQRVIYYCGDDFAGLAGVDHATVRQRELALLKRADYVFAASEALFDRFVTEGVDADRLSYLPHGVDVEHFAWPVARAGALASVASRYRALVGFYGCVGAWLDQALIAAVARGLPDVGFVFVGRIDCELSQLNGIANLHFIDAVPHRQLPAFSQHWQIAWLPFKDCAQIRACNPLKLREYLAAGKPVVSTDFPALAPYRDTVTCFASAAEAVGAIRQLLCQPAEQLLQRQFNQQHRVKKESWQARASQVRHLICSD